MHLGVKTGAVLALLAWGPTLCVSAPAPDPGAARPELDIVALSTMRTTPAHFTAYMQKLRADAEMCFPGLSLPTAPDSAAQPKPGAAWWRLAISHRVTIWAGPCQAKQREQTGVFDFEVPMRHEGSVQMDLMRWTGTGYKTLGTWVVPIAETPEYRQTQFFKGGAQEAQAPKVREDIRSAALATLMPPSMVEATFRQLLPVKMTRPATDTQMPTFQVMNRYPWPIKELKLKVTWVQLDKGRPRGYEATASMLDKRLMPGATTSMDGAARSFDTHQLYSPEMPLALKPTIEFDTGRGPEWVRRNVERMDGKDAGARQGAIEALRGLAKEMAPEETAVAIPALVNLMKHEAPQSEADVSKEALMALVDCGPAAVPALVGALKDISPGKRLGAVCVLRELKVTDKSAIGTIRFMAQQDKSEVIREAAKKALEALGVSLVEEKEKK